jgi:uncharacterized protein YjbI with pentapeptide repeats
MIAKKQGGHRMANQHNLDLLKISVKRWNQWRETPYLFRDLDLSGADLSGVNLSGADLGGTDLGEADLSGANLSGASLSGANLSGANLDGANFGRADLLGRATFWKANLSGASLNGADLNGVNLTGANLTRANLSGVNLSGAYLKGAIFTRADLSGADLSGVNLSGANLTGVNLTRADLSGVNLTGVNLTRADLSEANLDVANFSGADLSEANLRRLNLHGKDLSGANLSGVDLHGKDLSGANLSRTNLFNANLDGADLNSAILVRTNLEKATLSGCSIYGISVWNVYLKDTIQSNLIITEKDEPTITVDNLDVAQFIYLLLNNENIRHVIDTITYKVVLILGRFTSERKEVLDALRDELRLNGYLPILFDFEKPSSQDFTETVSTLAHLSRFIIADLTDPSSIPQELYAIVPHRTVPVQPLLKESEDPNRPSREYSMFIDLRKKYHWVLSTYRYKDLDDLLASLQAKVIDPAEQKAQELEKR